MVSERLLAPLSAALLAAALLLAPAARAEPSAADRETARALMKEGDRHLDADDAAQALRAYQAAHGIMNVPPTGVAVVRALTRLGRLVEARDVALQVIRSPASAGESPVFARAREEAAEAARSLESRIAGLVVRVSGASVSIDGVPLAEGAVGLVRKVDPGNHVVVVSAPGRKEARLEVTLAEGETRELAPELEPLADAPPVPRPPPEKSLEAPAQPARREAAPAAPAGASALLVGGASAAVLGVAVGSVTGYLAIKRSSDLRSSCPSAGCPPSRQADYDSAHRLATVSNIAFAVGAVGIGVGAYGWYLSKQEPATAAPRARVWPVAGVGSLGVKGRF